MYSLGLKLREWYKDFIPNLYNSQEIKIKSSYADRCLMSAQTLLAGLFPPKGPQIWNENLMWQPIPVKYLPRNMDNVLRFSLKYIFEAKFNISADCYEIPMS